MLIFFIKVIVIIFIKDALCEKCVPLIAELVSFLNSVNAR